MHSLPKVQNKSLCHWLKDSKPKFDALSIFTQNKEGTSLVNYSTNLVLKDKKSGTIEHYFSQAVAV